MHASWQLLRIAIFSPIFGTQNFCPIIDIMISKDFYIFSVTERKGSLENRLSEFEIMFWNLFFMRFEYLARPTPRVVFFMAAFWNPNVNRY